MLAMARKYVAEGLSVIPLRANGKEADGTVLPQKEVEGKLVFVTDSKQETFEDTGRPKTTWTPYQTRRATDEELVKWFADGQRNIGIVTGAISGFVVADADGPIGVESAKKLQLNSPRITKTTREEGGWHLWFKHPGVRVGNIQESSMHKKLDVRGDGGYVVAPPSQVDGKSYKWIIKPGEVPVFNPSLFSYNRPADASGPLVGNRPGWVAEELLSVEEGKRDNVFFRVCCKLRRDNWSPVDAEAMLTPYAEQVGGLDILKEKIRNVWARYQPHTAGAPDQTAQASSEWTLLSLQDVMSAKPVDWLIRDLIPKKSITWFFGNQGSGKSWVTMDLALRLSEPSSEWLNGAPLPKQRVLYIDEESSHELMGQRFRLLANRRAIDAESSKFVVRPGCDLLTPSGKMAFDKAVTDHRPDVVIMDSYSCFHTGNDNDSEFTTKMMNMFKRIVDKYGVTLIIVDHMSSGAASRLYFDKTAGTEVVSNDVAGNKIKVRQADVGLCLVDRKDGTMEIQNVKPRFGAKQAPVVYRLAVTADDARLVPETLMSDATEF